MADIAIGKYQRGFPDTLFLIFLNRQRDKSNSDYGLRANTAPAETKQTAALTASAALANPPDDSKVTVQL